MTVSEVIANARVGLNYIIIVAITALVLFSAGTAIAAKNLLNNGDLSRGSGDSVDGWRTDGWILTPGTTDYQWIRPENGKLGEVEVFTHHDNDARWVQSVSLGPGWYYISADVSTHKILPFFTGASISILEDGIMSEDLKGDNAWKSLGFYLKVGPHGGDVDVALRVGGYMNLTRGQAFFRDVRVTRIERPPPDAARVFDLDQVRKQEVTGPIGRPWTLAVTYVFFVIVSVFGWRILSEPAVAISGVNRTRSETKKRA
jgi:hypothetical protein